MVNRFKEFIAAQHLVPHGSKVLLAVSGGRDSVCMAHLFHAAGLPFAIAHCNFNLRPGDCDRDQEFVSRLAACYGVPFFTTSFDTKAYAESHAQSIEEAARDLRYGYFSRLCCDEGFRYVATAHHSDDSVETFFLNLFRGTGIAGLHGIRPSSSRDGMTLIRPMLCFSRREIDDYVRSNGLVYVEDVTNSQLDARRNRIRLQLMPLLRELYPSVDATMLANMERLQQVEEVYFNSIAEVRRCLEHSDRSPYGFPYCWYNRDELLALSPRRTLVYELLRRYDFSATAIDNIVQALVDSQTGTRFLSPRYMAVVDRDRLLVAEQSFLPATPEVDIQPLGRDQLPPSAFGNAGRDIEYIDADLVRQPLTVRQWRAGDRFYPFGMSHQRRLSDFLKDSKINIFEKYCIFVLVDADDRIVWVIGHRADNRFRITDATQRVLRLSLRHDAGHAH